MKQGILPDGLAISKPAPSPLTGPNGPLLLADHYLIEQISQARPTRGGSSRIVHAKGGGALGTFTATGDVSAFTSAHVFQHGAQSPVLTRFSTASGVEGAPDTWRDQRGFAVKFYTDDGNLDIVGNNSPVFYFSDPAKFPEYMGLQRAGSGNHDALWSFWTRTPESAHALAHVMGDRGVPRSWREQGGYGVHTFQWTNAAGRHFWVKYHFASQQRDAFVSRYGHEGFAHDEARAVAAIDADFHRRDLFSAIGRGEFPSWILSVQVMPYEDALTSEVNPFDATKVWSHSDYPLIEVGRLTLDRNPDDYAAQVDRAAFDPENLVPGTGLSPDPLLLARIRAYSANQRARLGAEYAESPVNRPLVADTDTPELFYADAEILRRVTIEHPEAQDGFAQAGRLVRDVMDAEQRERLVGNVAAHLLGDVSDPVLSRAFAYWRRIDPDTADRIENIVRAARSTR